MSIPDPIVLLDARAKYVHPAFQMTRASTKTVFDATGKLVTVPANALGWDRDPVTGQARGYLAEPSATNLLLHSNDLTQSAWNKEKATVTGNAITGPDGNGMAKLVENTDNSRHVLYQSNITISDGSTVVNSFIAKAEERPLIQAWVMNASAIGNNAYCNFDLTDGSLRSGNAQGNGEFVDAGITDLGGGFYRCWVAGRVGSGVTTVRVEYRMRTGADADGIYQGDGTSGLYLGYMQAEERSYPTSYIETGAATATRARDSLILSGLGDFPWWRSDRGTLLITTRVDGGENNNQDVMSLNNHHLYMRRHANGYFITGGDMVDADRLVAPVLGRHKMAVSWDAGGCIVSGDGSLASAVAVISPLSASPTMGIGNRSPGTSTLGGYIERAVYYPARLSNADLQSLTAIQE